MRWIFRIAGALLLVALLGVAAIFALPAERIAALATERLGLMLDREVVIGGDISPTIWPHLGVRAEDVRVGNPDWVTDGPLVAADALSIRVPWTAILNAEATVDEITLVSPDITLIRAADGRVSWTFGTAPDPEAPAPVAEAGGGSVPGFTLDRALIENGRVLYVDETDSTRFEVTGLDAELSLSDQGPASVALAAGLNGVDLALALEIDGLAAFAGGALRPVNAHFEWEGGTLDFIGAASLAPAFEGDIDVEATDFAPLARLTGQAAPDLPQGFGRDSLALSGRVLLTNDGTAHLRDAVLRADDTRLALALDLEPGETRPFVRITARGDTLDLSALAPDPAAGGDGGGTASAGWSNDPIDVSALFAADAEVAFTANTVTLGEHGVGPVALRITNDDGRAVTTVERLDLFGGTLAGDIVVNGRGGLSLRTDLIVAGVEFAPLLAAFADYDRLVGTGSLSLQVLAVGDTVAALMASLDGAGDLAMGAGALRGLDLEGMARTLDPSFQGTGAETVYDRVTANFQITGGVLANDDFQLNAPWGDVTGAGQVDIGARTLNYRVIPALLQGQVGDAGIRVPILITGPWAGPGIRPDLEFLARQELEAEAARIEAEARARLEEESARLEAQAIEAANDALGLDLQTGGTIQDAQDAVEDRLREEAENQLRGLLGGN